MNAGYGYAMYPRWIVLLLLSFGLAISASSQTITPMLVYEFDKTTMLENGWTDATSGFSGQAPGTASPIAFPPGAFASSQDQRGLAITVKPGEVAFLQTFFPLKTDGRPLLLRMNVRANAPGASVALAALRGNLNDGNGVDGSLATHIPASAASFVGQERRIVLVYEPDSGDLITPLIQVAATGQTGNVVVFVDKLEVLKLDAGEFGAAISSSPNPTPTPSPEPAASPTPTLTPVPELPQSITIPLPNLPPDAVPLEMVLIPAGTFMMGSPESDPDRVDDEIPQHQVTISQPFYMGKYEVTQEQWVAVMGINPSTFKYSNHPMDSVSWKNCVAFIQNLNILGLGTFRLPTEAEWEYACRAGTTTRYFWGDDPNNNEFNGYAWCLTNSLSITHRVGLKLPNPWGLYDIAGNVFEWCQDSYGPYPSTAVVDPSGPQTGVNSIGRGGCWGLEQRDCRSANREPGNPEAYYSYVGLRLVLGP